MVRTLYIESRCTTSFAEPTVGLLCGYLNGDKRFVILMCPCPKREGAIDDSIDFNDKWISSHSSHVSKMLPGGIHVIGLYVCISDEEFKQNSPAIKQVLNTLSKDHKKTTVHEDHRQFNECSLLLINPVGNSLSAKTIDTTDRLSNFLPTDVKRQEFLNRWTKLVSFYSFDVELLLPQQNDRVTLENEIQMSVAPIRESITNAVGVANGAILKSDEQAVHDKKVKSKSAKGHKQRSVSESVDLVVQLVTVPQEIHSHASDAGDVVRSRGCGKVVLRGQLPAVGWVPPRASGSDVLTAIKTDLLRSLDSRLSLLSEELSVTPTATEHPSGVEGSDCDSDGSDAVESPSSRALFPQRVLLNPSEGPASGLNLSDYAFISESREDVVERVSYFLGLTLDPEELDYSLENIPDDFELEVEDDICELVDDVEEKVSSAVERNHTLLIGGLILLVAVVIAAIFNYSK